jgi:hypothetical protein
MPFDQLSIVWQVWGYMLLGAIFMGCGLLVGIEWAWLASCARLAWTTVRTWCVRTFTDHPPTRPHTTGTYGPAPRCTGSIAPRRLDADEILITSRGRAFGVHAADTPPFPFTPIAPPADDTLRRRQLLALAETSPFRKTVH